MKNPRVKHPLLDTIKEEFQLKSDAELARFLDITPTPINDARRYGETTYSGNVMSAGMILRIYDKTGWSIEKIRGYLAWERPE
jgi:hypothetical protein